MNTVVWSMQILVAGVFVYAGFSTIFLPARSAHAIAGRPGWQCAGVPCPLAAAIALAEIAGAVCLVLPLDAGHPFLLAQSAAACLALLTAAAALYHMRRREPSAPLIALLLMEMFVIVGRLP